VNSVTKKPPKYHTEKTLLRVMETCGKGIEGKDEDSEEMMQAILSGFSIGTPATRAETIKKLKDIGYLKTKGKNLMCTELGRNLVETFPVKELFDLEYTGRLEKTLSDIEKGKFAKSEFIKLITDFTIQSVELIKKDDAALSRFKVEIPKDSENIGPCPVCGNPVIEGEKSFGCSNWKNGCKYTIWKDDRYIASFGKKISKEMVELLLKNGKVGFRNLKSKKGNTFSAYFKYEKNEESGYFNWKIEFIDNK
jgi:Topoisomerase IA